MPEAASNPCAGCQHLQEQLGILQAQVGELQATIDRLQEQLAGALKNSTTSSKPPSSDIVKPQTKSHGDAQDKRSQGAQPGHAKHERTAFPPEMVTSTI